MKGIVKGTISGLGKYSNDGNEKLEIRIPIKLTKSLPFEVGKVLDLNLKIGSIKYKATLRSTSNNSYAWISPELFFRKTTLVSLSYILRQKNFNKNDKVYLLFNGNNAELNPKLTRKQFIKAEGANCPNWYWSWSFVNTEEKVVIFGAWDGNTDENSSLILSEEWSRSKKGRIQPGYKLALSHIELIKNQGYKLKTFPMVYSLANQDESELSPAKIKEFKPVLTNKRLKKIGIKWYAVNDEDVENLFPDEEDINQNYSEGTLKTVYVNVYERNIEARKKCIEHFGCICAVCNFNFEEIYGELGKGFIHVHHLIPISNIGKEYQINPIKDLIPVCPNCHSMIHRYSKGKPLEIQELRDLIKGLKS